MRASSSIMSKIEKKLNFFRQRHAMSLKDFEAFEIVFTLSAPITLTFPWLFFDGIIAHLTLRHALSDLYYDLPSKINIAKYIPTFLDVVPIKRTEGIFHASVSIFPDATQKSETIYKRFEDRYLPETRRRKIPKGGGFYKDFMMQIIYYPAMQVKFFCFGNMKMIHDLCDNYLSALGAKTVIGWGAIQSITVKQTISDFSWIYQGLAMRPIPARFLASASDVSYFVPQPPYWDNSRIELCAVPFSEVKLNG